MNIFKEYDKFIAAETCNGIVISQFRLQTHGCLFQDFVTLCIAECMVDRFEIIEVDKNSNHILSESGGFIDCIFQTVVEQVFIRQVCQGIVVCQILQPVLCTVLRRFMVSDE